MSKTDIARALKISRPTVDRLIQEFLEMNNGGRN
jgi:DNA-binding transcriptional regulator LsrR (DeoR family)